MSEPKNALAELRERLGAAARANQPLARYTSIRVGGPADLFFLARTSDELARADDSLSNSSREEVSSSMDPTQSPKLGFENDVKPLFRERDRGSMLRFFDLWAFDDVVANGEAIAERLADGSMPCDGAWPPERIDLFRRWLDAGAPE